MVPEPIMEAVHLVMLYAQDVDDWQSIKFEIVSLVPAPYRKHFSRRHELSKSHTTNAMELAIVAHWKDVLGVELTMPTTDYSLPFRVRTKKLSDLFIIRNRTDEEWGLLRKDAEKRRRAKGVREKPPEGG
jgi:hypothetical protein